MLFDFGQQQKYSCLSESHSFLSVSKPFTLCFFIPVLSTVQEICSLIGMNLEIIKLITDQSFLTERGCVSGHYSEAFTDFLNIYFLFFIVISILPLCILPSGVTFDIHTFLRL